MVTGLPDVVLLVLENDGEAESSTQTASVAHRHFTHVRETCVTARH